MKKITCLFSLLFFATQSPLFAAGELNYNIVNLQAEAARQVDNDVMVVSMSALAEANTAAEASEKVNTMMNRAAEIVREALMQGLTSTGEDVEQSGTAMALSDGTEVSITVADTERFRGTSLELIIPITEDVLSVSVETRSEDVRSAVTCIVKRLPDGRYVPIAWIEGAA